MRFREVNLTTLSQNSVTANQLFMANFVIVLMKGTIWQRIVNKQ